MLKNFSENPVLNRVRIENLSVWNLLDRTDKYGHNFVSMTLSDGETTVAANFFNMDTDTLADQHIADYSTVTCVVCKSGNFPALIVKSMEPADAKIYSFAQVKSLVSKSGKNLENIIACLKECEYYCDTPENYSPLRDLALEIIYNNYDEFLTAAGGVNMHHCLLGELTGHILGMIRRAGAISDDKPWIDYELLLCGCVLHDAGKIKAGGNSEDSDHVSASIELIESALRESSKRFEPESLDKLLKMVKYHHINRSRYTIPADFEEARILAEIDKADAAAYVPLKAS